MMRGFEMEIPLERETLLKMFNRTMSMLLVGENYKRIISAIFGDLIKLYSVRIKMVAKSIVSTNIAHIMKQKMIK